MQPGKGEGMFQMPHIWTDTLMCSSAISPVKILFPLAILDLMQSDHSVAVWHILLGEICPIVSNKATQLPDGKANN